MDMLIVGLVLILGMHSVRIVAEPLRSAAIARIGGRPARRRVDVVARHEPEEFADLLQAG